MSKDSHSSKVHPGLERVPGKQNWIDKLPSGLKKRWHSSWIYRAAKHLHYDAKMPIGRAIAVAKNAAVKGCTSGDLNWPGKQDVNMNSRAQMCAGVATWKAMVAWTKTTELANLTEGELIELAYVGVSSPDDIQLAGSLPGKPFNPSAHVRGPGGKFVNKGANQANEAGRPTVVDFESALRTLKRGYSIELPGGKGKVKRLAEGIQVTTGDGKYNRIFKNDTDAITVVGSIVRSRYGGLRR